MSTRILAAVAVLVSAVVHLVMYLDWARHDDVLGPGFLLNAGGGAVIAVLLLTWRHWLPGLLAAGFGAATLLGFLLGTTVQPFGITASWGGWEPWVAAASELAAIVAGLVVARAGSGAQGQHHPSARRAHLD